MRAPRPGTTVVAAFSLTDDIVARLDRVGWSRSSDLKRTLDYCLPELVIELHVISPLDLVWLREAALLQAIAQLQADIRKRPNYCCILCACPIRTGLSYRSLPYAIALGHTVRSATICQACASTKSRHEVFREAAEILGFQVMGEVAKARGAVEVHEEGRA
jgi:hypothetical protein